MKIKTNLRAGSGGGSTSTDTSTSTVSGKGVNKGGAADTVPVVVYTRCAGY